MYCRNCGKEIDDDVKFCPHCGTNLTQEQDYYQPMDQQVRKEEDAPSFWFALLSFIIPVVGLVLFVVWRNDYPLKAKSCLNGFICNVVLSVVMYCCMLSSFAGAIGSTAF